MSNILGNWNPIFYAQEALLALENSLGMAARVHRGYEKERSVKNQGQTISIEKPPVFTSQAAPSAAQDIEVGTVDINLSEWEEVKVALTDQQLAYTGVE